MAVACDKNKIVLVSQFSDSKLESFRSQHLKSDTLYAKADSKVDMIRSKHGRGNSNIRKIDSKAGNSGSELQRLHSKHGIGRA
jgi:hypothetical protein